MYYKTYIICYNNIMPNICIVGFGSIGKQYYNVILEHFKDFRIYIISRRNIKIENAIVLNELKQLPNNIDYVIISNPAPFHLESAFYFLDKNIPVLIEKPLSHDLNNIDKLLKYNNVIHVGYQLKFSQLFDKTMSLIQSIGNINLIKFNTGQYLPTWRKNDYRNCVSAQKELGGGVILELSHEIDFILAIVNDYPSNVNLIKKKLSGLDINVEDTALITLEFKDILAHLSIDMINIRHNRTLEIIGSKGTILINFIENTINIYYENNVHKLFTYEKENLLLNELNHFFYCVKNKIYTNDSLNNAINVLKIII